MATGRGRSHAWLVGLAWALWALAIVGLTVSILVDQLLRRTGQPELIVLTPERFLPCSARSA
jgi:hypothetical protein